MGQQWISPMLERGHLTVFQGPGFTGSSWVTALKEAIPIFNALMEAKNFYLSLATSDKDPALKDGADIHVEAASKQASFSFDRSQYSYPFDGNGLHGKTLQIGRQGPDGGLEKMFVFVPATPRVGGAKSREVGPEVRKFILIHEFIHAAGLTNDQHTLSDVFCSPAEITVGRTPAEDRLHPWGSPDRDMPPYLLSDKTLQNLKALWPFSYR